MKRNELLHRKMETIRSFADFCKGERLPGSPLEVFLEVSNVCNLKCVMCAEFSAINPNRFDIIHIKNRGLMRPDALDRNIQSLLEGALVVHCSGFGESTIHPRFQDIVNFVAEYDVLIDFITNGQTLEKLADFLVDRGIFKLMVSCSGTSKEEYEQVYLGGNYDALINGLQRVKAAKRVKRSRYPIVEINSLGFKHHVDRFDVFVRQMVECGADNVHLKKLQPYDLIPELYEHVSVCRPWVEGKVIDRALKIAEEAGVHVSAQEYLDTSVHTEEEYEARQRQMRSAAEGKLTFAEFGNNTIRLFPAMSRAQAKSPATSTFERTTIDPGSSLAAARRTLGIKALEEAGRGESTFHCMEPFKTAFVSNDGGLRPCCFSSSHHPLLGSLRAHDGLDVWRGAGFQAVQRGILDGRYSESMCKRCLKDRIAPPHHNAFYMMQDFYEWYRARYGSFRFWKHRRAMNEAILLAQGSSPREIVDRHHEKLRYPGTLGAADALQLLLSEAGGAEEIDDYVDELLEGWLERIDAGGVAGWAWSPRLPGFRLPITVWLDGIRLATGMADEDRRDVAETGRGDGRCGFRIPLPDTFDLSRSGDVVVTVGSDFRTLRLRRSHSFVILPALQF